MVIYQLFRFPAIGPQVFSYSWLDPVLSISESLFTEFNLLGLGIKLEIRQLRSRRSGDPALDRVQRNCRLPIDVHFSN